MTTHATVWTGLIASAASALSPGYAMCKAGDNFVVATTANRTTYGRPVCIAITSADATNRAFEYQVAGVIAASLVPTIGAGTLDEWVRVDANGAPERVASPSSSDVLIGRATAAGDLKVDLTATHLNTVALPLSTANGGTGLSSIGGALQVLRVNAGATALEYGPASGVAGADTQVQFNDGGAMAGDAGFTYNKTTDTATLVGGIVASYGAFGTNPATAGKGRYPNGAANGVQVRNSTNATDLNVWNCTSGDALDLWGTTAAYGTCFFNIGSGAELRIQTASVNVITARAEGVAIGTTGTGLFGSGSKVLGIANATTNPTTNPSGGGVLYADAGAGKWRGSGGTTTTFGPADLDGFKATSGEGHCPVCDTDFALEWANDAYGSLTVCMRCLAETLGDQPWIVRKKGSNG